MWFRATCLGVCSSLACTPPPSRPAPDPVVASAPAPSPPATIPAPAPAAPPAPVWRCEDIRLGLCTGAAEWVAGCPTEIPASPASILRPEVLARLGPCFAAEPVDDEGCSQRLQSCVHDAVMDGAKPTSLEAARCAELLAACESRRMPTNYTHDECTHILAASAEGASRAQVEAALGPTSPEPVGCDATFLWPNMPMTPYFGRVLVR